MLYVLGLMTEEHNIITVILGHRLTDQTLHLLVVACLKVAALDLSTRRVLTYFSHSLREGFIIKNVAICSLMLMKSS